MRTTFQTVVGQKRVIHHLQSAIRHRKVAHAYLFHGDDGVGKRLVAGLFAQTLLCEEGGIEPCGKCVSCLQAQSGNQPDIIWVKREKSMLRVDEIREQLNQPMAVKPYAGAYKIFIVDEAEKMNEQAQNALVKTLEEPPAYGVILLLANRTDAFLDTILSRTVVLNFPPAGEGEIVDFLMQKRQVPDYQARIAAAFAGGSPGKALAAVDSEEFIAKKNAVTELLSKIGQMPELTVLRTAKEWAKLGEEADEYLALSEVWLRDVLHCKAAGHDHGARGGAKLMFVQEEVCLREQADKLTYEGLEQRLLAIEQFRERGRVNVNAEIGMERLLLTIMQDGEPF